MSLLEAYLRHFRSSISEGVHWDRLPSIAGAAPTISAVTQAAVLAIFILISLIAVIKFSAPQA